MDKYILTVDTGGSKTQMTVFDSGCRQVAELWSTGVGVVGNADLSALEESLEKLADEVSFHSVEKVIINVGGTNTAQLKGEFEKYFANAEVEAFRESSGVVMNSICEMEKSDVLLMAGTGIICFARGKNGKMITDAWGPNTGDKGSGYWIGLEAISRSLLALEGTEPLSPLAKAVTGMEEPFSAMDNSVRIMELRDMARRGFMPLDRMKTAGFARLAADLAREGDGMAAEIFREAGALMAQTVFRGVTLAGCREVPRIFISGGLSRCFDLWEDGFRLELTKKIPFTCYTGEADMTKGMLYYAKKGEIL